MNKHFSTSLICCDLSNIKEELDVLAENPLFRYLHADFMDGHFVPRYGISPELVQWIRKRYGNTFIIDSHLMTADPYTYMDVIAPYSDIFAFHYEAVDDLVRVVQKLQKEFPKARPSIAFNLMTSIKEPVENFDKIGVDSITFMGISPGVLGTNSYPETVLSKIDIARGNVKEIIVDGSVNFTTIPYYFANKPFVTMKMVCGTSTIFKIDEESKPYFDKSRIDGMKFNMQRLEQLVNIK